MTPPWWPSPAAKALVLPSFLAFSSLSPHFQSWSKFADIRGCEHEIQFSVGNKDSLNQKRVEKYTQYLDLNDCEDSTPKVFESQEDSSGRTENAPAPKWQMKEVIGEW